MRKNQCLCGFAGCRKIAKGPLFDADGPLFDANGPLFDANGPLFDANGPLFDAENFYLMMYIFFEKVCFFLSAKLNGNAHDLRILNFHVFK